MITLPPPICEYGYPEPALREILGEHWLAFDKWMLGQTSMICEGKPPCTAAHGPVCYTEDVSRFVDSMNERAKPPAIYD